MKHRVWGFIFLIVGLLGCDGGTEGRGVRQFLIPWPGSDGYSLQKVEVYSLKDIRRMKGAAAEIKVSPHFKGERYSGENVHAKFSLSEENLWVPLDFVSMQAVTAYAHMERLKVLDFESGSSQYLTWPRRIGVESAVHDENDREMKDNAVYEAQVDAIVLLPNTRNELPVSLNGGVLAHEHFHAIFHHAVAYPLWQSLPNDVREVFYGHIHSLNRDRVPVAMRDFRERLSGSENRRVILWYNWMVVRAINEGLADFWAWYYTGDDDFIGHSLPQTGEVRRTDVKPRALPDEDRILKWAAKQYPHRRLVGVSYQIGTRYARFLRHWSAKHGKDKVGKKITAKKLISALPAFRDKFIAQYQTKPISLNMFFEAFFVGDMEMDSKTCGMLAKVRSPGSFRSYERLCR